jgi:hypothetical protein
VPSSFETNLTNRVAVPRAPGRGKAAMVSIGELTKIEQALCRGSDARACNEHVRKIRMWLATGQASADVARKLEQLVGRFGNARFAGAGHRAG